MPRRQEIAPAGYFTLADAEHIIRVDRTRLNFWCSSWGAGLLEPAINPRTRGGTKLLSERDLVKIALIPTLLEVRLDHEHIRDMFTKAKAAWWDLSAAARRNKNFLDWIVLVSGWHGRQRWYLVASAYEGGPTGRVGSGPLNALTKSINDSIWKIGTIRGFQVIELSNVKRELLERIGR
ncbi:MAG TPA: hypothetical protein VMS64_39860 [Candidatus Methylomirabilis sp.]|nr:hypothetical protein [Candidatus Methylomirabilis sp.]